MMRLVFAIVLATAAPVLAQTQRLAIPAFYPVVGSCATAGPGCTNPALGSNWTRILRAGSAVRIVVAGLDSIGAGSGGTDCSGSPAHMFDCLRQNHVLVLGYVNTSSAMRDLDPVNGCKRADHRCTLFGGDTAGGKYAGEPYVEQWYDPTLPGGFAGHVDGIFFDVGPSLDPKSTTISEADQKAYYQSLFAYVKNRANTTGGCGATPGTDGTLPCVMVNASQFENDWVMSTTAPVADYAVLYERPVRGDPASACAADTQSYDSNFKPSFTGSCPANFVQCANNWYATYAPRAAHVLFHAAASDIAPVLAKSRSYGTPALIYLHEQDCDAVHGAVYSEMPSFFEQLVSAVNPPFDVVIPVTNASTGAISWVPFSL